MKKTFCIFLIFLTSIILWKCASQTTPTGGPKDETSPTLRKSLPANNEINFKGKVIELTFDELLQLNNPKEEIIITPSPGKDILFIAKQNRVLIEPKTGWKDSTTYSLTFREGIKDLNEGNIVEDLHLAFSTGPTIDSLQIYGNITESLTEKIPEKITVALYELDTFNIFQHNPLYFTKTKADGTFKIENLKAGQYFLYAFEDKNKNLRVDSQNEKFGFITNSVQAVPRPGKKKTDSVSVSLYQLDSRVPKITSIRNTGTITQIKLNKELLSYTLNNPDKAKLNHSFGQNQSEITIYNQLKINDSIPLTLHGKDSLDLLVDSTFYMKRIESKLPKDNFTLSITSASIHPETLSMQVKIKYSKPIKLIRLDSMYYTPDAVPQRASQEKTDSKNTADTKKQFTKTNRSKERNGTSTTDSLRRDTLVQKKVTKFSIAKQEITIDSSKNILTIKTTISKKQIPEKTKQINFVLEPGSIESIENDSSKREIKSMPIADQETTGIVLIEVVTKHQNYEIQLQTVNGDIIEKVRNVKKYSFKYLPAQECKILFYADLNNNGVWDPHNIYTRKQQEPTYFYKSPEGKYTFPIRTDWEVGPLILKF